MYAYILRTELSPTSKTRVVYQKICIYCSHENLLTNKQTLTHTATADQESYFFFTFKPEGCLLNLNFPKTNGQLPNPKLYYPN